MSLSGHRTPEAARGYVKKTDTQRLAAARKRRAWVLELEPEATYPPGPVPDLQDDLIVAIANRGAVYLTQIGEGRSLVRRAWRNYITSTRRAVLDEKWSEITPKFYEQARKAMGASQLRAIARKAKGFLALLPPLELRNDFTNVEAIAAAVTLVDLRRAVFRLPQPGAKRPSLGAPPSELPDALVEFLCIFRDDARGKRSRWSAPSSSFVTAVAQLANKLPGDLKDPPLPRYLRALNSADAIRGRIRDMARGKTQTLAGRNLREYAAPRA